MPGSVASSHLSPITPIPFDPSNSKISSLLTSPSTPGIPSLHRVVDTKHDISGMSLIFPTHPSTVPYKKKIPYSLPSTPSAQKVRTLHLLCTFQRQHIYCCLAPERIRPGDAMQLYADTSYSQSFHNIPS